MKQKILEFEKIPLPIIDELFFDEFDEFGRKEPIKDGYTFWDKGRKYIFDAKTGTYRVFYPRKSATFWEGIGYNSEKIEKGLTKIKNILKRKDRTITNNY